MRRAAVLDRKPQKLLENQKFETHKAEIKAIVVQALDAQKVELKAMIEEVLQDHDDRRKDEAHRAV